MVSVHTAELTKHCLLVNCLETLGLFIAQKVLAVYSMFLFRGIIHHKFNAEIVVLI